MERKKFPQKTQTFSRHKIQFFLHSTKILHLKLKIGDTEWNLNFCFGNLHKDSIDRENEQKLIYRKSGLSLCCFLILKSIVVYHWSKREMLS